MILDAFRNNHLNTNRRWLSQYCRLSFCREGTAWLLRPACVRFLSKAGCIPFIYNVSASTTRGAGVQMERYVGIWYHRGKYKENHWCYWKGSIIDHNDNLEMTIKHVKEAEEDKRLEKARSAGQQWWVEDCSHLIVHDDCFWVWNLILLLMIHNDCFWVNC